MLLFEMSFDRYIGVYQVVNGRNGIPRMICMCKQRDNREQGTIISIMFLEPKAGQKNVVDSPPRSQRTSKTYFRSRHTLLKALQWPTSQGPTRLDLWSCLHLDLCATPNPLWPSVPPTCQLWLFLGTFASTVPGALTAGSVLTHALRFHLLREVFPGLPL